MKIKTILPSFAAVTLTAAILAFPAPRLSAQTTGVSHPENLDDPIDANTQQQTQHYTKPSPAVPLNAPQTQTGPSSETYTNTYVPYTPSLLTHTQPAGDDHYIPPSSGKMSPRPFDPNDITSGVVTDVPSGPNELPIGTRIVAHLNDTISTKETPAGTLFVAALSTDIMHQGHVLLPAGTLVRGRITQIHGGRRISGASAIRLQPDEVILPNQSIYRMNAEVVDLDHFKGSHVGREGTIVNNSNPKATLAILGGTTATSAIAGAVIGGGVGAVVGAGIGAGVGTVWWLRQDHQQTLPAGTEVVFGLNEPLVIGPAN
jgi:hypothetical protein